MTMQFPSEVVAEMSVSWLAPRKVRNTIIVGDTRMLVYDDMDADEPIKLHDKRLRPAGGRQLRGPPADLPDR